MIQLYGRRWQIETYFKAAKQYLRFDKTQVQNYDGLCGHLAIVMMTYDLLAWQERQKKMNVLSETCSISWAKQCLI
nr:transposase [Ligilactobacillus agilis]